MWYKYLLFLLPLLVLAVTAQGLPSIYYTGYWRVDPGIRLYAICCIGSVQLPGNYIMVYAPGSGGIVSYISPSGLMNFSMDPGVRIKSSVNFTPQDPKVILTHGSYRVYFTVSSRSADGDPVERLYTATSTLPDTLRFSNITLVTDPDNSSFNNATAFISNPSVNKFYNGTIGIYYMYTSETEPVPPCKSLFMFATSSDGINFTRKGCVSFASGRSYNFIDPAWSILPNNDVVLVSATQSPLLNPADLQLGLYVSYSTDKTWLNFTTPKLIISPPGPNKTTEIDLLQDPNVNFLANGSYRMYYNVYPTLYNSNYKDNSSPIYIDSAMWVPTPNVSYNSSTTKTTTLFSSTAPSTITILQNNSSSTTIIQNSQQYKNEISILSVGLVIIIAVVILFFLIGRRAF